MPSETLFLFEDTFTEADWSESMTDARSDTLSPDRSSCTVTLFTTYEKYKSAIVFCLGYSWVNESNLLRRVTPVFHPIYPWLYASAVTNVTFHAPNAANNYTSPFEFAVMAGGYTHVEIGRASCRERVSECV